jgi:hypothetical protein
VNVHAVQLASADGQRQLSKLVAGVNEPIAIWRDQDVVNLDMLMKQSPRYCSALP